jgi:hypothetical protein
MNGGALRKGRGVLREEGREEGRKESKGQAKEGKGKGNDAVVVVVEVHKRSRPCHVLLVRG